MLWALTACGFAFIAWGSWRHDQTASRTRMKVLAAHREYAEFQTELFRGSLEE